MFYHYRHNNALTYYDGTAPAKHVIVEAATCGEADLRAEKAGVYFGRRRGDCPCCGDRWSRAYRFDERSFPHIYGVPVDRSTLERWDNIPFAIVRYLDGRIEVYD